MKVLVLGIGNVMYADEGIGVHFTRMIERNFTFKSKEHTLNFVDGGTMAAFLIPIIAEYDYLIVVDCLDADDSKVGDVYFFDFEAMPKSISWSGSAHEVEMLETLQLMDLAGDRPTTKIIGVIPKRIEPMSFALSSEIQKAVPTMEKALLAELERLGFDYERVSNLKITDISEDWKKEQF